MRAIAKCCFLLMLSTALMAQSSPPSSSDDVKTIRQMLEQQQHQIQLLQNQLQQSHEANHQMQQRLERLEGIRTESKPSEPADLHDAVAKLQADVSDVKLNQTNAAASTQEDQKRVGAVEGLLNRFRLSGDVRVRGESFLQDYSGCTACVERHRARMRLRLGLDGKLNEDFIGGIYLASGSNFNGTAGFLDPISTNQTLTDMFERKTIGFDRGWITYNPQAHKWLSLTGGKFAYTWQHTVLTFDNDLNPEGFVQKVGWDFSNKFLKNLNAQAMQLMLNEVSSGPDSNAVGGQFSGKLQFGSRWSLTPSYTILNWNGADAIAQAAFPVTLPQPNTPLVGTPMPQPTPQPVRLINANAFTNASHIVGTGTSQRRAFNSGFMYSDLILDNTITTPFKRFPWRLILEYENNLRAANRQNHGYWAETSLGQQKDRGDWLFGYSFGRVEQDAVISQFNESDMRAATNVVQHRLWVNWMIQKNTTAAFTWWVGRTLNPGLQNAAKAPGLPAGMQDPYLNRLQLDVIYKF
jgi:hypothetical protein